MPQLVPFFAGAAAIGAAAAPAVMASQQTKEIKKATENVAQQNAAAIQSAKDAQASASSQAQAAMESRKRAMAGSQTIFTSPLGIAGSATTARKTLLGQ